MNSALTRMKYFLLASFLNYLLPLSNRRKRKKYHQSFPLPVQVVPLFFTFAWRFSTKKKPAFWGCEKKKATTRTLAENSSSRMETSLRSWSLFYSCLENWILYHSHIYIYTYFWYPQTNIKLKHIFCLECLEFLDGQNISRIFAPILHMIHPSMDDVRSQVLMGTVRASVGAVFNKGHRNQHLKFPAWQHLT